MAVTGLQRNVIAMAFWCKSDGGQHQGKLPPPKATQHRSYRRFITVLRRDWVVVQDSNLRGDPFGTHFPPMQQWQAWMEL